MTASEIPNPISRHAMITDDGTPLGVVDVDKMQMDSIAFALDMAQHCADDDALDQVSEKWLNKIGVDGFGYVAAGALRMLARNILDPTLVVLEEAAPHLDMRGKLDESYQFATKSAI